MARASPEGFEKMVRLNRARDAMPVALCEPATAAPHAGHGMAWACGGGDGSNGHMTRAGSQKV